MSSSIVLAALVLVLLGCSHGNCSFSAQHDFQATAGQVYRIAVDGFDAETGSGHLINIDGAPEGGGRNVGEAWDDFEEMKRLIDQALASAPARGASTSAAGSAVPLATWRRRSAAA